MATSTACRLIRLGSSTSTSTSIRRTSLLQASRSGSGRIWSKSSLARRSYHASGMTLDYPPHTLFPMPALSPTMDQGTIASWTLEEGDSFGAGDVLCQIETDKATIDFESQDDGILAKILRRDGAEARDIPVGVPICVVVEDESDVAAFADFKVEEEAGGGAGAASTTTTETAVAAAAAVDREVSAEFALLPSARFLAESNNVDATSLPGTGKGGRVTKGDVMKALAGGVDLPSLSSVAASVSTGAPVAAAAAPTAAAAAATPVSVTIPQVASDSFEDVTNNNMRKIIARRLTESKRDVPHFYTSMEIELDEVLALRKHLASKHDVKVSVNDFILKSSAMALRDVPEVNASYDVKSGEIQSNSTVDISVAVATPTGLITPIVPRTDRMGLSDVTNKVRDLATRAREGKLKPEEYQGGTFTVSNLGMFGVDEFSAVINPPQAAILAVGGGSKRIVPAPYVDGADVQPKPTIRTVMTARLSSDRRVVDEPTAALFMQALRYYLSQPKLLML